MSKKIKKGTCSLNNNNNSITCYDLPLLKIIKDELYISIQSAIKNKIKCKDESCLLKIANLEKYYNKFFAPIAPEEWKHKKRTYLNTLHIEEIGNKFTEIYPNFVYLGTTPIDFAKKIHGSFIHETITNVNIQSLKNKNINSFGAVFNTDPHDMDGEHWICLYCDINKKRIYFYDSYAYHPEPEILNYMKLLHLQLGKGSKLFYNNKIHQKKGNECGMYCIYFLHKMIQTKGDFNNVINNMPNDDKMHTMRGNYFNLIGNNDD